MRIPTTRRDCRKAPSGRFPAKPCDCDAIAGNRVRRGAVRRSPRGDWRAWVASSLGEDDGTHARTDRARDVLTTATSSFTAEHLLDGGVGAPLDPLLRMLLDETANCAPLQTLPGHSPTWTAYGVRFQIEVVGPYFVSTSEPYRWRARPILRSS